MALDLSLMISTKIQGMNESATIRMAQKARDLASKGINVISLTLGEPDFDTPQHIKDKAVEALERGKTKYTPVPGTLELRTAICQKLQRENNLSYETSQIVVSNGAKQSIMNIFQSILDPNDEVVILAPYWVSYYEQVKFCDALPVVLKAGIESDFKVSPEQLADAINPRTRIVIFSSPCNPTGSVYTKDELQALADVVLEHDNLIVVSDEIYEYINFESEHVSIAQLDRMQDITAVVNGFSKGYAMTGWRLGYMAAPQWLASACAKVQGQVTSGANSIAQYAGCFALEHDKAASLEMVEAFKARKALIIDRLKEIPGLRVNDPKGAFYVFPDVSSFFGKTNGLRTIKDADELAEIILEEGHVGVVSGSAFGNDDCIRISYAASEQDIIEACRRLKDLLAQFH